MRFHELFNRLRDLVNAKIDANTITAQVVGEFGLVFVENRHDEAFAQTVATIVDLHSNGWDGIWCPILADRFAAGAIDLYTEGYRAKRLTERTGAVKEPDGTIHRLNVYSSTCSCRPRIEQTTGGNCIHLRIYTALRFIQLGKRLEKRKQENTSNQEGAK